MFSLFYLLRRSVHVPHFRFQPSIDPTCFTKIWISDMSCRFSYFFTEYVACCRLSHILLQERIVKPYLSFSRSSENGKEEMWPLIEEFISSKWGIEVSECSWFARKLEPSDVVYRPSLVRNVRNAIVAVALSGFCANYKQKAGKTYGEQTLNMRFALEKWNSLRDKFLSHYSLTRFDHHPYAITGPEGGIAAPISELSR